MKEANYFLRLSVYPDGYVSYSAIRYLSTCVCRVSVDPAKLEAIVSTVRERLGMDLLGIDVVVEKTTGRHAVIDINAYPGYYLTLRQTTIDHK